MSGEARVAVEMTRVAVFRQEGGVHLPSESPTSTAEWSARVVCTVLAAPVPTCIEARGQHPDGRVALGAALRSVADALLHAPLAES